MKPSALHCAVLRARRADDINCCRVTDEAARSAVLIAARAGERTTLIAAERPMKPPPLQYSVLRARRADDINCCRATDEAARSAVLRAARAGQRTTLIAAERPMKPPALQYSGLRVPESGRH